MRALKYNELLPKEIYIPTTLPNDVYMVELLFGNLETNTFKIYANNINQSTPPVLNINIELRGDTLDESKFDEYTYKYIISDDKYVLNERVSEVSRGFQYIAEFDKNLYVDYFIIKFSDDFYELHKNDKVSSIPYNLGLLYTTNPDPEPEPEPTPTSQDIMTLHNLANVVLGIDVLREISPLYRLTIVKSRDYILELKDTQGEILNPIKLSLNNTVEYRLGEGIYYLRCYDLDDEGNKNKIYYEEIYVSSNDDSMMFRSRVIKI